MSTRSGIGYDSHRFEPGRRLVLGGAIEARDHEQLLEELRRLRKREEVAGLQSDRHEEVARPFRSSERHRRRPDVDEALLVHRAPDRGDDRRGQPQIPLHPLATKIEVAVAKPQRLLDAFVVELERERIRARDDLERIDLQLHLPRGEVRIDGVGRARHDLALRAHDELGTELVGDRRRVRRTFRVHDQLDEPGVVAQVDEDEAAMIPPPVHPPRERDGLALMLGAQLTAGVGLEHSDGSVAKAGNFVGAGIAMPKEWVGDLTALARDPVRTDLWGGG